MFVSVSIRSFARKPVEDLFLTGKAPRREGWASAAGIVKRKLDMIESSVLPRACCTLTTTSKSR